MSYLCYPSGDAHSRDAARLCADDIAGTPLHLAGGILQDILGHLSAFATTWQCSASIHKALKAQQAQNHVRLCNSAWTVLGSLSLLLFCQASTSHELRDILKVLAQLASLQS